MAEIRKHQPHLRDEIDAAIAAALGDDVRPLPPGESASAGSAAAQRDPKPAASPASFGAGWAVVNPAFVQPPSSQEHDERD